MGKIKRLEEDVFRKIAAGEVVERPLSVVKELVENALDAGADEISVEIREGGKSLIKVGDNGEGFEADDIEEAFKRHSTSKITGLADFDSLNTLGFRGEALPSILEVSKIILKTSCSSEGNGLLCRFENNELREKEEIAFNRGTSIEVRELFYNFPVRRKFLKSERTELNQIISFLEQAALANYDTGFSLTHNEKTVFIYRKTGALKDRIYQVFGKDFLETLREVDAAYESYKVTGFISKINTGVAIKKYQYFFVNRRPVREKTLIAALNNTFRDYLEKSRSPIGILYLKIPPSEIDVNIHPMKLEIKFEDSSSVYQLIKRAIDSSLRDISETKINIPLNVFSKRNGNQNEIAPEIFSTAVDNPTEFEPIQARLFEEGFSHIEEGFYLIGQYLNSYILVEKDENLLLIDQHNAAERINFDRLKKDYRENKVAAITPLFPIIIELTPSEASRLDEKKVDLLRKLGFELRPLSGFSFDVKSFPQVLEERKIKDAVLTIIHFQEEGSMDLEDRVLAEIACKSAIKVNHRLYPEKMKSIVKDLFLSGNPYFCPHKRPIIVEFTRDQIEKLLKRK